MHPRTARLLTAACLIGVLGVLGGCAEGGAADDPADDYTGPLYVDARHGAAGEVVQCESPISGGFNAEGEYDNGAVADDPQGALETARHEAGFDGARSGYRVAAEEPTRVLFVHGVDGAVKQALVVHDGETAFGEQGWYLESWARCDLSEFPDAVAEANGTQVWTDESGARVPTGTIKSYPGPEHCDWQDMTFLHLGKAVYVREPDRYLREFFAEPYDPRLPLPAHAVDTGYARGGEQLWLSPDQQRAYVGVRTEVDLWPRTVEPLLCA